MAEWLAQLALATCATTATTAVPDREPPTQLAVDIDGEQNEDVGYIRHGYADGASWDWLRAQIRDIVVRRVGSESELEKEAFRMAMGGENSCKLARDSQLHEELLQQ